MALIHRVASSFLPEKSVGRVAFSSAVCEDIMGGGVGTGGTGPTMGAGDTGSREAFGAGDKGCSGWGFLGQHGRVAEVRTFSIGASSSS